MSEGCSLTGLVTIRSGDTIIAEEIENHWLDAGLKGLASAFLVSHFGRSGGQIWTYAWAHGAQIRVGSDSSITTMFSNTITDPVASTSTTGTNITKDSNGNYVLVITGTWVPGAVTVPIKELGLFLNPFTNTIPYWVDGAGAINKTYPEAMCARISEGDGVFTAFTPKIDQSLSIEWSIRVINDV
jgi:hypothetical protein